MEQKKADGLSSVFYGLATVVRFTMISAPGLGYLKVFILSTLPYLLTSLVPEGVGNIKKSTLHIFSLGPLAKPVNSTTEISLYNK